ncbi:hypothetical protein [Wukongibacter sp. M2B1]|uniref:hypothetical protein n=1 Tax=Wukongibacter sp. M2B1 TaxID=3088895 RepID=UPI003D7B9074
MRIGFLGSKVRLDHIKKVIDTFFTDIDTIYIVDLKDFHNMEIEDKLKKIKKDVNGFIFAGELQYHFYNNIFFPDIPCDYVRKDWSSLQNSFLGITLKGIDFTKVSIDSYSSSLIHNLINDLGVQKSKINIKIIERKSFDKGYTKSVYKEHKRMYLNKKVEGCITALSPVYERLSKESIPSVYAKPTTDVIIKTINHIKELYDSKLGKHENIAIIIIQIIPKKEYSYIRKDEYLYMHEKIKVAEEVYYFAKNTNAAVVNESIDKFVILMNQKDLIEYTNGMQRFYLLNSIYNNTNCDINIGIGYGFNPSEAKFNANLAIEKADINSKNITYIVCNSDSVIGPLDFLVTNKKETENEVEDRVFLELSRKSSISQSMIYKIYILIEKYKKNTFTSLELSKKLNISQRSTSRLLRKLEDHNMARIVGKKMTGNSGRPSDIYEIKLL